MKWAFMEVQESSEEDLEDSPKLLWLLALLRAQYWSYQQSHWTTRGDVFYGNHLLFQRLYSSVPDQVDGLAEKIVGMYGPDFLDQEDLLGMFLFWNERWDEVGCLHERGLTSEEDCQTVLQSTYDELKETGEITLGMDDFLMSLASDHETNQYLLQQVLDSRDAMDNWVSVGES